MIKFTDASLLAFTKLRSRKFRTIITVILASLLFGVLVAASLIMSGAFRSLDSFRADGLTSRYIVSVSPAQGGDSLQDTRQDPQLVAEAKARYEALVEEKAAEAKRLGLSYTQASDQPPYTESSDGRTTMLSLRDPNGIAHDVLAKKFKDEPVLDQAKLDATARSYGATSLFESTYNTVRQGSTLEVFADNKEVFYDQSDEAAVNENYRKSLIDGNNMTLVPSNIVQPFILPGNAGWKPDSETIPIVLPQNSIEQLLGLNTPAEAAGASEKIEHLKKVRAGAANLSFKACYRNDASSSLIQQTLQQQKEIKANVSTKDYQKPSVIYELPDASSCANPTIASDTRTAEEKDQDAKQKEFDEKFNDRVDPVSYYVSFKVVGVSPSQPDPMSEITESQARSASDIINDLLETSGVGQAVPQELYNQLPNKEKFADLFTFTPLYMMGNEDNRQRYVEFANAQDAQKFIDEQSCTTQVDGSCAPAGRLYQAQLAFSNSAALEDIRAKSSSWFTYAMLAVVILAAVIMWITIGRTITDGRHETAVFRAIGFKRIDIAATYTLYTVVLSILVALFALGIGALGAYIAQQQLAPQLTAQAQYGFGGLDMSKEVSLVGIDQQQLGLILAACIATGLLSMTLPLLRNVRRSPIRNMREE